MGNKQSYEYKIQADLIKGKLNGREYSLGLDLGVGSIGLAVVALEKNLDDEKIPTEIVFATSRIFKSSAGAQDRREKRSQRNSLRHRANRLKRLWMLLASKQMMLPFVDNKKAIDSSSLRFSEQTLKLDPYKIRYKGLTEPLNKEELGLALYHIANHRGSSSISSFDKPSESEKKFIEGQNATKRIQTESGLSTFIEIITKFNEGRIKKYRNTSDTIAAPIPIRDIIINETNKLLDMQQKYHSNILTNPFIQELKDIMFYENEMIVPPAGFCPYFPEEKKLPKVAFINEERRIWEALNNARYVLENLDITDERRNKKLKLTLEQKEILFKELRGGNDLTTSRAEKLLNLSGLATFVFQGKTKEVQKISGFKYKKLEDLLLKKKLSEEKQNEVISILVNSPNEKSLKSQIARKFVFSEDEISQLVSMQNEIPSGYAPIGYSAMIIILPYIKDFGFSYQEAENKAIEDGQLELPVSMKKEYDLLPYYGEVIPNRTQEIIGKAWHPAYKEIVNLPSFLKPNTVPIEEKYGKIANPVVHQTLNELRKLVNEVITILEKKPSEITIEVGKELKVGKEKREEMSKEQFLKEKENKRIYKEYCLPHNLSEKKIRDFKLFEEQEQTCPYCLKKISVDDIVHSRVDVDHIFPEEDFPDTQLSNLVLAHKHCNEKAKQKRTPFEAFHSNLELWNKIEQYLESSPGMNKKKWKFEMTDDEYQQFLEKHPFLNRFKTDNAYIARVAMDYLKVLLPIGERHKAIRTIKGGETYILRKAWKLNGITNDLASLHSPERGEDIDEKIRDDVRHHALDAIVTAYYTNSFKYMINNAKRFNLSEKGLLKRLPIPKYYIIEKNLSKEDQRQEFKEYIKDFILNKCFISRKVVNDKNGELLKDTVYSIVCQKDNDIVICTKKSLISLKPETFEKKQIKNDKSLESLLCENYQIPKWVTGENKKKAENYLETNKKIYEKILSKREEALLSINEENKKKAQEGRKVNPISEREVLKRAISLINERFFWKLSNNKKNKIFIQREPDDKNNGIAIDTGDNYSLDLFIDNSNELRGEVIRKIDFLNPSFNPAYKVNGYKLFERIYPKDILEIEKYSSSDDKLSKIQRLQNIKIPNAIKDTTYVVVTTFTEVSEESIQVYFDSLSNALPTQNGSIYVSGFKNHNFRKVKLSNAGLIKYRSKLLKVNNVESN